MDESYFASISPSKYLQKCDQTGRIIAKNSNSSSNTNDPNNMNTGTNMNENESLNAELYKICKGREIGDEALSWALSSAKPGHGVHELRDNDLSTFWQSDGSVPHKIEILFHKKQSIAQIAIYTDYQLDESYTPECVSIKSCVNQNQFEIVFNHTLKQPKGWQTFEMNELKTNRLQIEILSSHQSGRDTHIRQIKLFAPNFNNNVFGDIVNHKKKNTAENANNVNNNNVDGNEPGHGETHEEIDVENAMAFLDGKPFTSATMLQYSCLR